MPVRAKKKKKKTLTTVPSEAVTMEELHSALKNRFGMNQQSELVKKDINLRAYFDRDVDVHITHGEYCHVLRSRNAITTICSVDELSCDHEEADTRLLLHAQHASTTFEDVVIVSCDSDVGIISLCLQQNLSCNTFFMTGNEVFETSRIMDLQKMTCCLGADVYARH